MYASLTVKVAVVQASATATAEALAATATATIPAALLEYIELTTYAELDTTGRFRYVPELVLMLDAVKITAYKALQDSQGLSDNAILAATKRLADSFAFSDYAKRDTEKLLTDSVGQTELLRYVLAKLLADSFGTNDAAAKTASKALGDAFGLTDQQTFNVGKVIADSVSFTETLYRVLIFIRNVADSLVIADAVSKLITKAPFEESVSVSDASTAQAIKVLNDSVAMDDGTSVGDGSTYFFTKNINNVVFATELIANLFSKPLTDSVGLSESGLVRAQSYCDISYFDADYVGASSIF